MDFTVEMLIGGGELVRGRAEEFFKYRREFFVFDEEICEFAPGIGRGEHDDAAEILRLARGYVVARDEAAHGMGDEVKRFFFVVVFRRADFFIEETGEVLERFFARGVEDVESFVAAFTEIAREGEHVGAAAQDAVQQDDESYFRGWGGAFLHSLYCDVFHRKCKNGAFSDC